MTVLRRKTGPKLNAIIVARVRIHLSRRFKTMLIHYIFQWVTPSNAALRRTLAETTSTRTSTRAPAAGIPATPPIRSLPPLVIAVVGVLVVAVTVGNRTSG